MAWPTLHLSPNLDFAKETGSTFLGFAMDPVRLKSMCEHMTHGGLPSFTVGGHASLTLPTEHSDTLSYYLRAYVQDVSVPESCVLKRIDESGMVIEYKAPGEKAKRARQTIAFPRPVT